MLKVFTGVNSFLLYYFTTVYIVMYINIVTILIIQQTNMAKRFSFFLQIIKLIV